jgi:hypothetical protein
MFYYEGNHDAGQASTSQKVVSKVITFVSEIGLLSLTPVCGKSKNDAASCLWGRDRTQKPQWAAQRILDLSPLADSDSPCGFHLLLRPPSHVPIPAAHANLTGGLGVEGVAFAHVLAAELRIGQDKVGAASL